MPAAHLRIDTIEAALARSALAIRPAEDAGYVVGCALATDLLRLGLDVVADSVNPLEITRAAWRAAATQAGAAALDVEVTCSDLDEHRRRVETRQSDIETLEAPDWGAVATRESEPWSTPRLSLDSAALRLDEMAARVVSALPKRASARTT